MSERYRLVRLLGGGGMAEVYLAVAQGAEGFEKPVAIKRVLAHLARDEQIVRMFVAEAKLAMHLHHQNIVEVFDVGRGEDGIFLVMELVNGWDLGVVLAGGMAPERVVPEPLAAFITSQVVAGLLHAYSRTLGDKPLLTAHRDISPSNILVTVEGEVKLGDFGIAKLQPLSTGTAPGTFKGKVAYAAPEVIHGAEASHLSDQFSLGVVLHELITGQHPFGRMENLVLYSEALARSVPPALPGIAPELAAIIRRLLAMAPAERFPSMEELGGALGAYLARAGVPASAGELAAFLKPLGLPPSPLKLFAEGAQLATPPGTLDPTFIRATPQPIEGEPSDERIELAEPGERWPGPRRPVSKAAYVPEPEASSGASVLRRLLLVIAVLAALAAAGFLVLPLLGVRLPLLQPRAPATILQIDSSPPGATVSINGKELGETPLFLENEYPPVEIHFRLTRTGYQPWTGTFMGGQNQSIKAKLRR